MMYKRFAPYSVEYRSLIYEFPACTLYVDNQRVRIRENYTHPILAQINSPDQFISNDRIGSIFGKLYVPDELLLADAYVCLKDFDPKHSFHPLESPVFHRFVQRKILSSDIALKR